MKVLVQASEGDVVLNIVVWAISIAFLAVLFYVVVGVLLLPLWGVGAALHSNRVARLGRGWWGLPLLALETGESVMERLTAPRDDGARKWERKPEPEPEDSNWAQDLGHLVLWVLAIVGGLVALIYGHDAVIQPLAGSKAGTAVTVGLVALTLGCAAIAWVLSQRYSYGRRPPAFRFWVAAAIFCGVIGYLTYTEVRFAHRLVGDYCAYGSVSQAQLDGCKSHVTANKVRDLDTPAAVFARGSSESVCGAGSGPFCEDVLNRRFMEDQAPPPGQ